jgi:hypothetical protein
VSGAAPKAPVRTAIGRTDNGIREIRVEIPDASARHPILVPAGTETPHDRVTGLRVEGAEITAHATAGGLGLGALLARPTAPRVAVVYSVAPSASSVYPEPTFRPRANRHTTAAADLATASREIAVRAGGGRAAVEALVAEAGSRFAYTHPEIRFTDGLDAVPHLSCGLTPGSCVDINTYLVASLRAAGIEAGYLVGYFFPEERGGVTHDMHCWVVTRAGGEVLEWDIAHHIKAGLGPTRPGLNPRPGRRVAVGHSMGHSYDLPEGRLETKLLAEPVRIEDGTAHPTEGLTITAT